LEFPVKPRSTRPCETAASSAAVSKQPLLGQLDLWPKIECSCHHPEDRASLKVTAMLQKMRKARVDGRIKPIIIEIP